MSANRSPSRSSSGPGRGPRQHAAAPHGRSGGRTRARGGSREERPEPVADRAPESEPAARSARPPSLAESRVLAAVRRRSSLTTRAIALAVVLLVLTISYASSLRIYLSQRHEIASTRVEIADRQAQIAQLQNQIDRWNDPNYVKTQARARLGWVVPGETGYRVIGPDGVAVGASSEPSGADLAQAQPKAWWENLWGSVKEADAPPAKPANQPTVTEDSAPKR